MLARLRISVPDRPGSLGALTTAVGRAGADVVQIEVLEAEAGRALDDLVVAVRDAGHLQTLRAGLDGLTGVRVMGVLQPSPPVTGHADLELVAQLLGQPARALTTLVDGAPGAFGADWAAAVEYDDAGGHVVAVLETSAQCPGKEHVALTAPLRPAVVRLGAPAAPDSSGVLVPLSRTPVGLLLVRRGELPWHANEVWRAEQLGRVAGQVVAAA